MLFLIVAALSLMGHEHLFVADVCLSLSCFSCWTSYPILPRGGQVVCVVFGAQGACCVQPLYVELISICSTNKYDCPLSRGPTNTQNYTADMPLPDGPPLSRSPEKWANSRPGGGERKKKTCTSLPRPVERALSGLGLKQSQRGPTVG